MFKVYSCYGNFTARKHRESTPQVEACGEGHPVSHPGEGEGGHRWAVEDPLRQMCMQVEKKLAVERGTDLDLYTNCQIASIGFNFWAWNYDHILYIFMFKLN